MLVDFVAFSGEVEMLQAHLKHMNADLTIIYEADKSFTGLPKPLTDVNSFINDKVLYLPIKGGTDPNPWVNEYAQRTEAFEYLLSLDIPGDAVATLCDVDEFMNVDVVQNYSDVTVWNMRKYQMSAKWFQKVEMSSMSGSLNSLFGRSFPEIIRSRSVLPNVNGGWHFSSFLTLDDLQKKWRNFSHQELVRENMDGWVSDCWVNGWAVEDGVPMNEVDDLSDIPAAVLDGPEFWFRGRPDVA